MNVHQTLTSAVKMRCVITLMDPTVAYANKDSWVTDSPVRVSMISSVLLLWQKKNQLSKVEVSVKGKPSDDKTFVFISLVSMAITRQGNN